ncbi:MAG: hypothetical protein J6C46_04985 [Clostridia bacterium]|nr:hypothetical protein [Clostridia bacterium]
MDKRRIKVKYFSGYPQAGDKLAQNIENFYNEELSPNDGIILDKNFTSTRERIHCFITYYFPEKIEDVNLHW